VGVDYQTPDVACAISETSPYRADDLIPEPGGEDGVVVELLEELPERLRERRERPVVVKGGFGPVGEALEL
jgi:hypothetical protein